MKTSPDVLTGRLMKAADSVISNPELESKCLDFVEFLAPILESYIQVHKMPRACLAVTLAFFFAMELEGRFDIQPVEGPVQ